jgi:hypothetical protein
MNAHDHAADKLSASRPIDAKLRPNPFSQVTIRWDKGRPAELRLWSVTRSRGAVTRNFARDRHADFDRVYQVAAGQHASSAKSLSDLVLLTALGLWAPDFELIDPVRLHAPLASGPDQDARCITLDDVALRGEVWLQEAGEPPPHLAHVPLACLSEARPILWHRAAPGEPTWPWWPSPQCLAAMAALQRAAPRSAKMLPALAALAQHGIVGHAAATDAEKDLIASRTENYRDQFARQGFAVIRQLLPPGQAAAVRRYWQQLAALDVIPDRGDGGARGGSHGEPSSALFLYLLQPLVNQIIAAATKPAYSYAWLYKHGAALPPHRDRDACHCTVSVLVDYAPAVDGPTPWPLGIHPRDNGAPIEIRQEVGDAVIFGGRDLTHFRPPFTAGTRSVSLLLHYVDRAFPGVMF